MRVYDGMPSFLNPLEPIVGGAVDIPIGSKWIRVELDTPPTNERFIGQEVEVVDNPTKSPWGRGRVWIKRKYKDGTLSFPRHLSKEDFLEQFIQVEINLENK